VTLFCGLYQFEPTPPHAELLGRMAKIAAAAHAPFLSTVNIETLMDRRSDPHPLVVQALEALKALPEASHLGLFAPRFLLRHPYGKRSDPVSSFAFEEFTSTDGLRGMLWGHPALVAACLLAGPKSATLSLGDLPFHYYVDDDGDQVPLPCTERLVTHERAGLLRRWGISGLMAHKGQPELRVAGLETVGGMTLALQGTAKPQARMGVSTSLRGTMPEGDEPKGKGKKAAAEDAEVEETSDAAETDAEDGAATTADDGSGSDDSSLDDLLASLGGDEQPSGDAPAEAAAEGGEPEMDPDLAALLKSLE
jgi:type VI secretion system protein ImpC